MWRWTAGLPYNRSDNRAAYVSKQPGLWVESVPATGLQGEYVEQVVYQNNQDCEWESIPAIGPQGYRVCRAGCVPEQPGLWVESIPAIGPQGEYVEQVVYQNNQDCEWNLSLP